MNRFIGGIQQVGIGVENAEEAFQYYKEALGFSIRVFDDEAPASFMSKYTGGKVYHRRAILALNSNGGGGFEIWQFTNRAPQNGSQLAAPGSKGIFAISLQCGNIEKAQKNLLQYNFKQEGEKWFRDKFGNLFYLEDKPGNYIIGGVCSVWVGVGDMQKSKAYYQNLLECTSAETMIQYNGTSWGACEFECKNPNIAPFSGFYGDIKINLVQAERTEHLYENRYWGDLGYIHVCLDVVKFNKYKLGLNNKGLDFTVDSLEPFKMGKSAGRFSYLEDPDGSLIECVEIHKLPVFAPLGIYLKLGKKNPKPLSSLFLKLFRKLF